MKYMIEYTINGTYLNLEPFFEKRTHTFETLTEIQARKHIDDYVALLESEIYAQKVEILYFYQANRLKI